MTEKKMAIGESAPDFSLRGVDEQIYSLATFADKKLLLIIFSCNHCPYVQAYEDRIIALQNEFASKGLQILAINSNDAKKYEEDSYANMKKRAEQKHYNFPYLHDESQQTAEAYQAAHTPEIFLFDADRKLAYSGKIDDNWQSAENARNHYLRDAIDELLSGKSVSVPETFAIGCTIKWK